MATMKIGDQVRVWWHTGRTDGVWNLARVLEVHSYRGRYPEHFDCVLTLDAPTTKKGTIDMAYNSRSHVS